MTNFEVQELLNEEKNKSLNKSIEKEREALVKWLEDEQKFNNRDELVNVLE